MYRDVFLPKGACRKELDSSAKKSLYFSSTQLGRMGRTLLGQSNMLFPPDFLSTG